MSEKPENMGWWASLLYPVGEDGLAPCDKEPGVSARLYSELAKDYTNLKAERDRLRATLKNISARSPYIDEDYLESSHKHFNTSADGFALGIFAQAKTAREALKGGEA